MATGCTVTVCTPTVSPTGRTAAAGSAVPPRDLRGLGRGRGRRVAAVIALILGLAGFAVSAIGVALQLMPRHFSAGEQRQIEAWEVMRRWQTMPAGKIFPASVPYQLPAKVLQDVAPLNLERAPGQHRAAGDRTAPRR